MDCVLGQADTHSPQASHSAGSGTKACRPPCTWTFTLLSEHGLTPHHFGVLMVLQQLEAASQQQLSRLVGVDPRNVVAVLDVLERERLIRRRAHPTDRRRHTVSLTPAGRQLLAELGLAGDRIE